MLFVEALRGLVVVELVELLVGHLLAPVPALAPRAVVLEPSSSAATSSFSSGSRGVGAAVGPRRRLAHRAPPHFASTVSQPSPSARRARGLGHGAAPRRAAVQHDVPGAVPEQAALLALGDDRHAGRRVDAHAHQHRALDRRRGVRARQLDERVDDLAAASSQKRASSSSSLRPARCPRTSQVGVLAGHLRPP